MITYDLLATAIGLALAMFVIYLLLLFALSFLPAFKDEQRWSVHIACAVIGFALVAAVSLMYGSNSTLVFAITPGFLVLFVRSYRTIKKAYLNSQS